MGLHHGAHVERFESFEQPAPDDGDQAGRGDELREFTEHFPDRMDTTVKGGVAERNAARAALKMLVLNLRKVALLSSSGSFDDAMSAYQAYMQSFEKSRPTLMAAVPYSLFTPSVHDAHYAAFRQMLETAASAGH